MGAGREIRSGNLRADPTTLKVVGRILHLESGPLNIHLPEKGNSQAVGKERPGRQGLLASLFSTRRNPVVVVSGLPRSGTSLMMAMLRVAGYDLLTDQVRQGDEFNPNGYFELERVKNLKEGDHAWLKQAPGRAVKVVSPLLQYLPNTYNYQIIFMQRELSEVLASQNRMLKGFNKTSTPEEDHHLAKAYGEHLARVREWMARQANIQVFYASYNQLMSSPQAAIEPIARFLGCSLDMDRMQTVVNPQLYRNRVT